MTDNVSAECNILPNLVDSVGSVNSIETVSLIVSEKCTDNRMDIENTLNSNSTHVDDAINYNVDVINRFGTLGDRDEPNISQPKKKSKSVSEMSADIRYEDIEALKLQIANINSKHLAAINELQSRINSISNAIADDMVNDPDSGFTLAKSPIKLRRKLPRQQAVSSNSGNVNNSNASGVSGSNPTPSTSAAAGVSHTNIGNSCVPPLKTSNISQVGQTASGTSSARIPPFFIYNIDYKFFKNQFPNIDFKMQILNNNLRKVTVLDLDSYVKVREALEESEVKFYTFTPKNLRPINYIIRGLDLSYEEGEVMGELKAKFPNLNFLKVSHFSTRVSRRSGKNLNLWLVQLAPDSVTAEFRKLNMLLHSVISVEPMKSGGVVQCWNCQRFDHVAANCGMPYRCMKCNVLHIPGECQVNEIANFVCVNCGGNHSTNFSECPKKLERVGRARPLSGAGRSAGPNVRSGPPPQNFPSLPTRSVSGPVTATLSYANAVSGNGSTNNNNFSTSGNLASISNSPFGFLQTEANALFGCSISAILGKIKTFMPIYNGINDIIEKKMTLLNFLFDMVSNG